jgi:DNA-binding NarL/FixJ family response regulator
MSTMKANTISRPVKILIVDDHPIVRRGLAKLVEEQPGFTVCGQAAGAADALEQLDAAKPDLIVVDISLKDIGGIELIKQIKARQPAAKMLVSSMHDESLYAERALRAGAKGYINKEEATEKMMAAIKTILNGKVYLSEKMTDRMLHRAVTPNEEIQSSPIEGLSDRELEVFELIGDGLTTRQIAKKLYLSTKTIETYREHIKTKLNVKSSAELVRQAVRWQLEKE